MGNKLKKQKPENLDAMLEISGVGNKKLASYGNDFFSLLKEGACAASD